MGFGQFLTEKLQGALRSCSHPVDVDHIFVCQQNWIAVEINLTELKMGANYSCLLR